MECRDYQHLGVFNIGPLLTFDNGDGLSSIDPVWSYGVTIQVTYGLPLCKSCHQIPLHKTPLPPEWRSHDPTSIPTSLIPGVL